MRRILLKLKQLKQLFPMRKASWSHPKACMQKIKSMQMWLNIITQVQGNKGSSQSYNNKLQQVPDQSSSAIPSIRFTYPPPPPACCSALQAANHELAECQRTAQHLLLPSLLRRLYCCYHFTAWQAAQANGQKYT
jgi:hypothetical protein